MIRLITYLIIFIRKFFELFKQRLELDDKKLWIEVPTIYMSKENKQKTILNAVNILEHNIKIK